MFEKLMSTGAGGGSNSLDLSATATAGNIGAVNFGGSTYANGGGTLSTFKLVLIGGAILAGLYLWKKR